MARKMKTAQDLLSMSNKKLKRLYSSRSYEARKKLKKLEEKYGPNSSIVSDMLDRFKPLKEMGELSHRQLAQAVARTYDFGSSKTGQTYENIVTKLKEAGFPGINNKNVGATFDFMDDARARGIASIYDSTGDVLAAANRAVRQGLTLEEWRANVKYWAKQNAARAERGKGPARPRLQSKLRGSAARDYLESD